MIGVKINFPKPSFDPSLKIIRAKSGGEVFERGDTVISVTKHDHFFIGTIQDLKAVLSYSKTYEATEQVQAVIKTKHAEIRSNVQSLVKIPDNGTL